MAASNLPHLQLFKRLLKGGAPSFISSAVVALVPLSGTLFLDNTDYAVWALVATLSTIFVLFDMGTTSLATKLAAERRLGRRVFWKLASITATPPLLLGALAAVAWPGYSALTRLGVGQGSSVVALIAAVAIGTSLRSAGLTYAAVSLGAGQYTRRAFILLTGAAGQVAVTLTALASGASYWALGFGVLVGGLVQLVVGMLAQPLDKNLGSNADVRALVRKFVRVRGAAITLGLIATQLDRWFVGLVAEPSNLAAYDVVARFATIPKIALLAFAAGLVAEGARNADVKTAEATLRVTLMVTVLLYGLSCLVLVPLGWHFASDRATSHWVLLVVTILFVAHGTNSATIGPTLLLTGLGHPEYELRYLVPLALGASMSYLMGIIADEPVVLVSGWAVSLFLSSLFFVIRSRHYLKRSFGHVS